MCKRGFRFMKLGKFLLLFFLGSGIFLSQGVQAAQTVYADSWGKAGFNLLSESPTGVDVSFSVQQWFLENQTVNGQNFQTLRLPGVFLPNDAGAPDLPGTARFIAIPQGATASVRIVDYRTETIPNVNIIPAPIIPKDSDTGPLIYRKNTDIYSQNAFYPESPVKLSSPKKVRGVDVVLLGITPFQYNPVTKELLVYKDIRVEVTFTGGNGYFGEDRLRSRWWDPILKDMLFNTASLPEVDYNPISSSRSPDYEYIIITPDDPAFIAWGDSIKEWRTLQGIRTGCVTTTEIGGNTTMAIETYINDAYDNWDIPPSAVLLLGDYGTSGNTIVSPVWNSYCVSDNIYADRDGDDLPDMAFARITAQDAADLETMIGKFLSYERQPPTSADFYDHPIIAGGWQTERWFILCCETIYGFLANEYGKHPVREYAIYSGTPGSVWSTATNTSTVVDYFGPSGLGYLPATPAHLTDWGATAARLNADINAGAFILQHRDHGGETAWGEPDYDINDLSGLNNDELVFVFSINCLTGKYNIAGECFAEAFHRHQKGALGIIAASETSYSFVNDTYVWGMYDYMWPDFDPGYGTSGPHDMRPAFANSYGKIYLQASSWPYNDGDKQVTHYLFHHHGDAYMTVYTEVPQALTVSHESVLLAGVNYFNVTADAGAFISLTLGGEILGVAEGTGSSVSIPIESQIPGNTMIVTVTKQNYFRYAESVPVITPEGPYVITAEDSLDDTAGGNGNGLANFGETLDITLTEENVGVDDAYDVTVKITTTDSYLTITDSTEYYGTILVSQQKAITNGYQAIVATDVPDGHIIHVDVTATDGSLNEWYNSFTITAHAPDVVFESVIVDDAGGDSNGRLDPGETVDLEVSLHNNGGAELVNVSTVLSTLDSYITMNTGSDNLASLAADASGVITFNVTAESETPIGHPVTFDIDITGDNYTTTEPFGLSVGLSIEDFETGNFTSYPWNMGGNAPWTITSTDPYEGTYCSKSGTISNDQTSDMSVNCEVVADGSISFYYKVSSESNYDYLRFFIDGVQQGSWSGTIGWTQATYSVTTGNHTFLWRYSKDYSVSSGSDCAWVDYIIFPPIGPPLFPNIDLSPLSFDVTVDTGAYHTEELTVGNAGEADLGYTVVITTDTRSPSSAPFMKLGKNEIDPRVGTRHLDALGGPDEYGYTWIDSDESGGPVYDWVDISSVGTSPGSGDDGNYGPFNLGFPFSYYGTDYTSVRICTNGWISFTSTSTAYSNQGIPYSSAPNDMIAPFWDDLNPSVGGTIYYYSDVANSRFIVQWDAVPHYSGSGSGTYTFEVILYDDGRIVCQYNTLVGDLNLCTIGIENSTGSDGLEVVFNASYLHNGLAILFEYEQPWLTVEPKSGSVVPLNADILDVNFNSSGLSEGVYTATITVNSNDPDESSVNIPVTMHVGGTLEPVTDVTAFVSGTDIELSWTASTGATSYNVYRIPDPFATPTPGDLIGTPTTPGYTDENVLLTEEKAFYVIVAVN